MYHSAYMCYSAFIYKYTNEIAIKFISNRQVGSSNYSNWISSSAPENIDLSLKFRFRNETPLAEYNINSFLCKKYS